MFDEKIMKVFYDVYGAPLPRLAPGDEQSTRRALEVLYGEDFAPPGPDFRVLDLGCGNGTQTLRLVAELGCRVIAIDNHQPYLDELERRAEAEGVAHLVETRCEDMNALEVPAGSFDLAWAEGAPYIMGVAEALKVPDITRDDQIPPGCSTNHNRRVNHIRRSRRAAGRSR